MKNTENSRQIQLTSKLYETPFASFFKKKRLIHNFNFPVYEAKSRCLNLTPQPNPTQPILTKLHETLSIQLCFASTACQRRKFEKRDIQREAQAKYHGNMYLFWGGGILGGEYSNQKSHQIYQISHLEVVFIESFILDL